MQRQPGGSDSSGLPLLLGIALVVDDANKGQRLVFRYPALREHVQAGGGGSSSSSSSSSTLAATRSNNSRTRVGVAATTTTTTTTMGGSNGSKNSSWALQRCVAEFHQLSPEVFARLFRPKAPLCGRLFQVSIDRVRYLSCPVLTANATKETAKDDVLLFNVILAMARLPTTPQPQDPAMGPQQKWRSSRQMAWLGEKATTDHRGCAQEVHDESEARTRRWLRPVEEVLDHLTKALLHEERRCRYVSKEVGLLLHIRETMYGKEDGGRGTSEEAQTMLDTMMEQSALANDLKEVFHGLKEGGGLDVAVNGWIQLSVPRPQTAWPLFAREDSTSSRSPGATPQSIDPMHTLLLLVDEETVLDRLPKDGSQQLAAFVQAANPLKTLEEISAATRIALPQLDLLAAHLVHWGCARVIRTISLRSIYAVKPSAPTQLHSLPAMAFEQRFPGYSFFRVLGAFGAGKSLQTLLEGLGEEAQVEKLAQVVWLLQHDFIEEIELFAISV